jgi:acyl-CoA reductase-like NAD-dependent aldehyde dehydrogenase
MAQRESTSVIKGHFIDGKWRTGTTGKPDINPSDLSDVVDEFVEGGKAEAEEAIAAAKAAFPAWANASPQVRADVLDKAGTEILNRREELGKLLAREEGKTLPEAIGEVVRAGHIFKFFAGEALRLNGEVLQSVRPGLEVQIFRQPLGVIGLITPWNFPIAIPAWKLAPALAYGNTVVIKPADLTPACAWTLFEILERAGLPQGVANLVFGRGSVVGQALIESPDVNGISITGSVTTGRAVVARCAQLGKRVQAEMGGKNPMIVLDDADLDVAVNASINGAFFSTGQRCTASSRLIVTEGIHDRFVAAMKEKLLALKVGHALDPQTEIGPVVDQSQLERNLSYLDIARQEGAEVIGGALVERPTKGYFMQPALFLNTTPSMRVNREEIFGPIASVIRVKDYEEALRIANDTEFGLSAGICTSSLKIAQHFKRHAAAGLVMINAPTAGVDYHVPFGGVKGSNYGPREQGTYAREFYTTVKTVYVA